MKLVDLLAGVIGVCGVGRRLSGNVNLRAIDPNVPTRFVRGMVDRNGVLPYLNEDQQLSGSIREPVDHFALDGLAGVRVAADKGVLAWEGADRHGRERKQLPNLVYSGENLEN